MMTTKIDIEIESLRTLIIEMTDMVSDAYVKALDALENEDYLAARLIAENDAVINAKELEIEEKCMGIIATLAPKAIDLRRVTGYSRINNELERIGDYAKKVSKMVSKTKGNKLKLYFTEIKLMMTSIIEMLGTVKASVVGKDADKAYCICEQEEVIDETFEELVKKIIDNKELTQKETINLILTSKELERSGDHLVNICENLIFISTGKKVELE